MAWYGLRPVSLCSWIPASMPFASSPPTKTCQTLSSSSIFIIILIISLATTKAKNHQIFLTRSFNPLHPSMTPISYRFVLMHLPFFLDFSTFCLLAKDPNTSSQAHAPMTSLTEAGRWAPEPCAAFLFLLWGRQPVAPCDGRGVEGRPNLWAKRCMLPEKKRVPLGVTGEDFVSTWLVIYILLLSLEEWAKNHPWNKCLALFMKRWSFFPKRSVVLGLSKNFNPSDPLFCWYSWTLLYLLVDPFVFLKYFDL